MESLEERILKLEERVNTLDTELQREKERSQTLVQAHLDLLDCLTAFRNYQEPRMKLLTKEYAQMVRRGWVPDQPAPSVALAKKVGFLD